MRERPRGLRARDLRDAIRPASKKLRRQARLECLYRRARLEPRGTAHKRHPQHRRPRTLRRRHDRANRFHASSNPLLSGGQIHPPTMPRTRPCADNGAANLACASVRECLSSWGWGLSGDNE